MNNSYRKKIDESEFLWDGNPEAIEVLYDQFAAIVYGIILRTVKEKTIAAELLNQTFIYIRKHHSEFDESKQNLSLWVIGIARKIAQEKMPFYSYVRNHKSTSLVNHTPVSESAEQGQAVRATSDITNSMTAEERKVLDLIFFGGGRISEVANYLGMNETKVKQLLKTALNHYRKAG